MNPYKVEIKSWQDWNAFANACRENINKRAVFAASQNGEDWNELFIVKTNVFDDGDVGFFDTKTGKKCGQYCDGRNGFLEWLAGPVGKVSLPFFVLSVNHDVNCYVTRPFGI